jgi:DNA primase
VEAAVSLRAIPASAISLSAPETPSEAILWVLEAGLTPERAETIYGMKYDPVMRRVCIPIEGGFLARAVFNERPKYIKCGASKTEMYKLINTDGPIVMVEDILSAIAVNRAGFNSVSILGTAITVSVAAELGKHPFVISWTDGDKAGDMAWVNLRKKMGLYDTKLKRIRTDKDPKNFTQQEIKDLIWKTNLNTL